MIAASELSDLELMMQLVAARSITNGHDWWAARCEELYQEQKRREGEAAHPTADRATAEKALEWGREG